MISTVYFSQEKVPRPRTAELIADAAGVEQLLQGQVRGAWQVGACPEVQARRRRQRERHAPQLRRVCGECADKRNKSVVCLEQREKTLVAAMKY